MKKLLCGYCLVASICVYGQQTDTLQNKYLDEVVVSANRWEQNLSEVPARIAKIEKSDIQFFNPQTAADLLGLSNQVFIQKSQLGGGSPMLRGFATNRVLLVIDGVRLNNAIFRGGNVQNVISLDANAIQESEVIFGPGSVIYGSDAIGGVMDFHTLTPTFSTSGKTTFNAQALARYSTANQENTGHVHFNIGLKNFAFTTSVTKSIYDDLTMGSRGPIEYTRPDYQGRENNSNTTLINPDINKQIGSAYEQLNAMQKVRFRLKDILDLTYSFHFSETSDVPRYDRLILKNAQSVFANAEWYYGPQRWRMHSLQAKIKANKIFADEIKFVLAHQSYDESRHTRNFAGSNANRRTNRFESVDAFSANVDVSKSFSEKTSLFYGAEFVTNEVLSIANRVDIITGDVTDVSTRYPDGSDWRSLAAYASVRHQLTNNVTFNASVRYTHVHTYSVFDKTFFPFPFDDATLNNGAWNGSVGTTFKMNDDFKIYYNVSTGFRAPNVDDIGRVFDSQPGSVTVPNPSLKPETVYNFETGFAGKIHPNITVDAAFYYTILDNAIVRGDFLFNGEDSIDYDGTLSRVLALQNTNRVVVMGGQVGVKIDVLKGLSLQSNINLQRGEEKDFATGNIYSPTHVPPTFGNTQINYQRKKWRATVYVLYNGTVRFENLALTERADAHLYAKDKDGNPYVPNWHTWNAKFSYDVTKNITCDVGIENIADIRYRPYSSGISAPGRNFIFALRGKF
ncbi:MAG: TonB-dependent receptor [Cyclobacteriaceae bacterium]|nr:TonB-dependent receptor [Cyclobacteriaceae bacterium]